MTTQLSSHSLPHVITSGHTTMYQIQSYQNTYGLRNPKDDVLTGANEKAIGSGAYLFETYGTDRMIYLRNDNWWGNKVFGQPKPKRIVYLTVSSNNVALGMIMKGETRLF